MATTFKQDLEVAETTLKRTYTEITSVEEALVQSLGLKTQQAKTFLQYALANARLFDRKHLDYGPDNINEFGAFGCVVRMSDKLRRLKHLYMNRRRRTVNESLEDSFRDTSNYGIIALMHEHGKWEK